MTIYEKLNLLLARRGLSQSELARRAGLPQPRVNAWLKGRGTGQRGTIKLWQALALARGLGVRLDWLADPEDRSEPDDLPSPRELQVRELLRELGWDEAFRRLAMLNGAAAAGHPAVGGQTKVGQIDAANRARRAAITRTNLKLKRTDDGGVGGK